MHRFLAGHTVRRFESVYPALTRVAEDRPVVGRTIDSVVSRGKHLLIVFSGDLVLRTHLRMNGSWHLYRSGAPWRLPSSDMRVLIATTNVVAVAFRIQVAEFLEGSEIARSEPLRTLGPDLLATHFDSQEVIRRMRAASGAAIADVLLDQRVVAGIGNEFKSEILFLAGVHPFTPAGSLADSDLQRLIEVSRAQLAANVLTSSQSLTIVRGRRTTRRMDPSAKTWVYGRLNEPCRKCGTRIRSRKTGIYARLTYWCPQCQP